MPASLVSLFVQTTPTPTLLVFDVIIKLLGRRGPGLALARVQSCTFSPTSSESSKTHDTSRKTICFGTMAAVPGPCDAPCGERELLELWEGHEEEEEEEEDREDCLCFRFSFRFPSPHRSVISLAQQSKLSLARDPILWAWRPGAASLACRCISPAHILVTPLLCLKGLGPPSAPRAARTHTAPTPPTQRLYYSITTPVTRGPFPSPRVGSGRYPRSPRETTGGFNHIQGTAVLDLT